jgi:hypothetical protein
MGPSKADFLALLLLRVEHQSTWHGASPSSLEALKTRLIRMRIFFLSVKPFDWLLSFS